MEFLATVLLERAFQSSPPTQVSEKSFVENTIRRSLFVEIEFIEQTLDQLRNIIEFSEMWDDPSNSDIEEFIKEVRLEYDVDAEVEQSGLSMGDFYEEIAKNAALLEVSQAANGRLSTSIYDGSAAMIGVFSDYEMALVIQVYSLIKIIRELLSRLGDNLGSYGILPNGCLHINPVTERDYLLEGIGTYVGLVLENVADLKEALG